MTDHDNTNRGAIWPNQKKETDNHPDFTGSVNVAGVEYWVSAWKRKADANPKAPSLSFSVQAKDEQSPNSNGPATDDKKFNSGKDIPF